MGQENENVPTQSGKVGYGNPPVEFRFKPGNPGGPGRKAAGATVMDHMISMEAAGLTEPELRLIARDKYQPWNKRTAAERMLRTIESGDLADMEPFMEGEVTLRELRESGVNTEVIRKVKTRRRTLKVEDGKVETEVEREVELRDKSGEEFDRVLDRLVGRPAQQVNHGGSVAIVPKQVNGVSDDDL